MTVTETQSITGSSLYGTKAHVKKLLLNEGIREIIVNKKSKRLSQAKFIDLFNVAEAKNLL